MMHLKIYTVMTMLIEPETFKTIVVAFTKIEIVTWELFTIHEKILGLSVLKLSWTRVRESFLLKVIKLDKLVETLTMCLIDKKYLQ